MPRFTANLSTMFQEVPLPERFDAARRAGFKAVEIQFPYTEPPDHLDRARRDAGVEVVLINTPAGDFAAGDRGVAAIPGREAEFRSMLDRTIEYGEALGVSCCHVMAGIPGAAFDRGDCMETFAANLRAAASRLAGAWIRALVEALNSRDVPGYFITDSTQAIAAIDMADHPNLGFQYDVYHLQIMQGDLIETLRRLLPRIGHVQFADNPGRHEPGTGEINMANIFKALDDMGYDGWVGAEYVPSGRTEDSLAWFRPFKVN